MASARRRWVLLGVAISAGLAAVATAVLVFREHSDPSIELSDHFGTVQNGTAYDRAEIDPGDADTVVLPVTDEPSQRARRQPGPNIRVYTSAAAGSDRIEVLLRKTLGFHGHLPEPVDIREERKNFNVRFKREGKKLLVAVDPGGDSAIEGGFRVEAIIHTPPDLAVVQKPYDDPAYAGWSRTGEVAADWMLAPQRPIPKQLWR